MSSFLKNVGNEATFVIVWLDIMGFGVSEGAESIQDVNVSHMTLVIGSLGLM